MDGAEIGSFERYAGRVEASRQVGTRPSTGVSGRRQAGTVAAMVSTRLTELRRPVVLVAFSGWNDAGDAASGVIDHIAALTSARLSFALDPDNYYDFQVNRPSAITTW